MISYPKLESIAQDKKELYQFAQPFPHIALDNIWEEYFLEKVSESYGIMEDWHTYDNTFEKKLAFDDKEKMTEATSLLLTELASSKFVSFIESITGKKGLIPDPHLRGGGMHKIRRGGKLDIHADFNWHPRLCLNRSVNLLIYLNKNWEQEWNGDLELWDSKVEKCVIKYAPKFNRMVLFNSTDTSYHGHPEPLQCPEWIARKSIAFYYYESPLKENPQGHSTAYKKRPGDETTEEIEAFREKRSKFQDYSSNK